MNGLRARIERLERMLGRRGGAETCPLCGIWVIEPGVDPEAQPARCIHGRPWQPALVIDLQPPEEDGMP
jgi:hypothetical protein